MSAKVALIIGDYSNGWNDAMIVQNYFSFKQEKMQADRGAVMSLMTDTVVKFMSIIENNEKINPKPKDEPCCDLFENWAKGMLVTDNAKMCPYCGTLITEERAEKYMLKGDQP